MPFEYRPHRQSLDPPIDPDRCKASVSEPGRGIFIHQCKRKPKKDGWCSTHHPEAQKERDRKADERYRLQRENSVGAKLDRARNRIKELKAACLVAKVALFHIVPDDCWSTGPLNGDRSDELCPGCNMIKMIDDLIEGD